MVYSNKCCPYCTKAYEIMTPEKIQKYGCSKLTCEYCGRDFIAAHIIEPATVEEQLTKPQKVDGALVFTTILGAGIFSAGFFGSDTAAIFFVIGGLLFVGGVYALISSAISHKKDTEIWEAQIKESWLRLQDNEYAHALKNAGHYVPKRFLK